ncbi:MAG TPA: undecaprenyl-diphosphate phosphatase [Candidatus Paceibacterota bacterium]|nr:undecaprenyl-diphosphate phosphatase [Candidatus Paceibacterota bacterium]
MGIFEAALLGVVEGITEFLPISSTGHLILVSSLLGIPHSAFHKSFEIIIQLGAISSVILLFWRSFLHGNTLLKLFVAFLPTAAVGFLLYETIKTFLIGNERIVVWALLLGGIALIIFELIHKERPARTGPGEITYGQALVVGIFQSFAVIPGVSRSAASIVGGLIAGMDRTAIVEFSFLLAVPTLLAATGLDIYNSASLFSAADIEILAIGFIASFVVALFTIQFLLSFVRNHTFIPFGVYRILLAIFFFLFIL